MGNWDKETTKALKQSISHHEDNLHKLRTAEGEFRNNRTFSNSFTIGKISISYTGSACSLCLRFDRSFKNCKRCPLVIKGYGCKNEDSIWFQLEQSKTRPEAIKAEKNMVRVLREMLGEEEFEVGDKVRIIQQDKDDGSVRKVGIEDIIVNANYHENGLYSIRLKGGCCVKPRNIELVERSKSMSQHDTLKARIEKVTAWDKEADDILQEILKHWNDGSVYLKVNNSIGHALGIGHIQITDSPEFAWSDQGEKLEAFKEALMWLLNHSDIRNEKQEEIGKIKEDMKVLQGRLDKLA